MLNDPGHGQLEHAVTSEDRCLAANGTEAYAGQRERRLSLRLLNYWRHLRGVREFATYREIDFGVIPEIAPHLFILDVSNPRAGVPVMYVGEEMTRTSVPGAQPSTIADVRPDTLLGRSSYYYEQVVRRRCPITIGGEFVNPDGAVSMFRSVMAPLSDDGLMIDAVLGVGSCKVKGQ
ncbi:MAG TPA: hypothetical protein VEJ16_04140 [Alphaproteobacteria bacterium]|nr:hypothetical protein [Alphaproteobacteria bacterium]